MTKEIKIEMNEDDIVNGEFNNIDKNTGELILNISIDDLKRKRLEKLDNAHRGILDKKSNNKNKRR